MSKPYHPHLHVVRPRSQARRRHSLWELLEALSIGLIIFAGLAVLAFLPALIGALE